MPDRDDLDPIRDWPARGKGVFSLGKSTISPEFEPEGRLAEATWSLIRLAVIASFLSVLHNAVAVQVSMVALVLNYAWIHRLALVSGGSAHRRVGRRGASEAVPFRADLMRARSVVELGQVAEAHIVSLGDKQVLWSSDGEGFLMYARQGRHLVGLFDPVAPASLWPELIRLFARHAEGQACTPVFYQMSPAFTEVASRQGMRAFKLGELAEVRLRNFSMAGKDWASLRRAINRAERDGLQFEMVSPEEIAPLVPELKAVSDSWLAMNKAAEKRFSLGRFTRDYLCAHPLGLIRFEGRIVAFVNVMTAGENAFIDLMRFEPGVHRGVMDLLMVRVIEELQSQGYNRLNLGMAPLAGLRSGPDATLWDRAGCFVFKTGNRFYNFHGLLAFKSKFDPEWTSRYLVVPATSNPYQPAIAVATLIAGGISGLFRR